MAFRYQVVSLTSLSIFLFLFPAASAAASIFLPIFKTTDGVQPRYHGKLQIGTPPLPIALTLDVNYIYSWLTCDAVGYNRSSTYSSVLCESSVCKTYAPREDTCINCDDTLPVPTPSCNTNQCGLGISTPFSDDIVIGGLVLDSATLFRRAASTTLPSLPVACVQSNVTILKGLSRRSSNGILSFSRAPIGIQNSVASAFNVSSTFAFCLPSSTASNGAVYFGGGPYSVPDSMVSIPLVVNSAKANSTEFIAHQDPSFGYYVKLTAVEIDGTPVVFNSSFLTSFEANGDGGTLVSPIFSYGQLRSEIYKPFVDLYVAKAKAMNVKTVNPPRKEFGACFDPNSIRYDPKTGSGLPVIDLVSEGNRRWRIFGSNSVVDVRGASCLAFVEGKPLKPKQLPEVFPAVVIGGVQMEDNLVEFDAEKSTVRVTSSLLRLETSCSQA